jgi:hypothetical protein
MLKEEKKLDDQMNARKD